MSYCAVYNNEYIVFSSVFDFSDLNVTLTIADILTPFGIFVPIGQSLPLLRSLSGPVGKDGKLIPENMICSQSFGHGILLGGNGLEYVAASPIPHGIVVKIITLPTSFNKNWNVICNGVRHHNKALEYAIRKTKTPDDMVAELNKHIPESFIDPVKIKLSVLDVMRKETSLMILRSQTVESLS